jgi:hypothetical protein
MKKIIYLILISISFLTFKLYAQTNLITSGTDSLIFLNAGSKSLVISPNGSMRLGNVESINASALLQLNSTTKGFLAPRMTLAQRDAISSPANGLLIYNTSSGDYNFYNGIAWKEFSNNSSSSIKGSGVVNYTARWISSDSIAYGAFQDDGINAAIGTSPNNLNRLSIMADGSTTALAVNQTQNGSGAFIYLSDFSNSSYALRARNDGLGPAGEFQIVNSANGSDVLSATTNGAGSAFNAFASGDGNAIKASVDGAGNVIDAKTTGTSGVGFFEIINSSNSYATLTAVTNGSGSSILASSSGTGSAGQFTVSNAGNTSAALSASSSGTGPALQATSLGTGNAISASGNNSATALFASNIGNGFSLDIVGSGTKTIGNTMARFNNTSTSSTASTTKTAVAINSTGTWNGAGSINRGLDVNVSGGTINQAALFNGGNVGIGTTSPTQLLDVANGNISISNTGTAGELRLLEPSASGNNYTAIKSGAQAANITYTLPTTLLGGNFLTTDGSGNLSWGSVTGTLSGGTANTIPKWLGTNALTNSSIFDNGISVGIGTLTPSNTTTFHVVKSTTTASGEIGLLSEITGSNGNTKIGVYGWAQTSGGTGATSIGVVGIGNTSAVAQCGVYAGLSGTAGSIPSVADRAALITNGGTNPNALFLGSGGVAIGTNFVGVNCALNVKDGHLKSQQTALPNINGTGLTSYTPGASSTDVKGLITTTGSLNNAQTATIIVTYNKPYTGGSVPVVILTPANAASAIRYSISSSTPSGFTVHINNDTGAPASNLSYYYMVIE